MSNRERVSKALSVTRKTYEIKDAIVSPETRGSLISGDDEPDSSSRRKESVLDKRPKQQLSKAPLHSQISSGTMVMDDSDDSDDDDETFPITATKDTSFYEDTVDEASMTKTMTIALTTVFHSREIPNDDTNKQVADYVMKVFHSDEETLRKGWRKASMQEKPEEKLLIYVRSGSGLTAKDANGKSDPYVRVGIIDAAQQGESIVKKEDLLDWQKEGGIMPTGEIQQTKVKEATLEPQWNEQIELSMGKTEKEMLVVEVWDSDKHMAAPSKVKGLKHFFKDIRKTDDFMGRAFLSLWSLSGRVEGKVMQLCSHSGKHKHGTVTVDLTIERVKKNVSQKVGMWEHLQLTHAVVNYESRVGGQYRRKWNAQLSDEATMLLDRHAEFSGLSEAHKAAIRLSVLVKYHRMFAIKMSTFSALIEEITKLEGEINALQKTGSTGILDPEEIKWVHGLLTDLTELSRDIEEVLKNHLTVYSIKDPKHIERIRHRVNILIKLYSFRPFVEQLPPAKRKLSDLLEICIQKAVPTWFNVLKAQLMPDRNTPDMQLSAFKGLIQHILNHCHRSLNKLNPIFEQAGVDYFSQFYVVVDTLVFGEAVSKLDIRESPDDITTYEVYKAFKEIRKLRVSIARHHWANLKINAAHELFTTKVNDWVSMATVKCKGHIRKAIELDKVVQVTDEVQFSSSAVDSTGFLFQLMKLSDELEWPSKAEALTIKVAVVRNVCEMAIFYVGELYSSLRSEDMFDKQGRFRATEKLSIVLNNMQHIKHVIVTGKFFAECEQVQEHTEEQEECPINGHSEQAQKKLEEEKRIREHSMELMTTLMQSAGEDIDTKIADIIRRIIEQMSPEMNRLIEDVLDSKTPTVGLEAMDPLMTYLASNLQTLGNHLLTPVFQLILRDVWHVSNDCLLTFLSSSASKKTSTRDPSQYYNNLKFVLQSFKDFFYAGGNGLSQDDTETEKYKGLGYQLDILSLRTDRLILRFYSDLADIQAAEGQTAGVSSGPNLGKLLLSIGYHQEREVIEVNLFQGNKLPGLDNSGLSDPFVELTLMPSWHFGHSQPKKQKTAVKKKTVNPVFNEDFVIPASKQAMQVKGAILLLTIYDHDLISANDLCGICVVPCKDIPHLSPVRSAFDNPNAIERKNLTLQLFKVPESSIALKELTSRANSSDPKATEFLKNNKHILSDSEPETVLPHQKLREFLRKQ